jgi:hypothetical protein
MIVGFVFVVRVDFAGGVGILVRYRCGSMICSSLIVG